MHGRREERERKKNSGMGRKDEKKKRKVYEVRKKEMEGRLKGKMRER